MKAQNEKILVVDLDGSLVKTDLLYESANHFLCKNPLNFFLLIYYFFMGRQYLKYKLSQSFNFDPATLPYNEELLYFLKMEAKKGRKIVLASASYKTIVEKIYNYFNFFEHFHASDQSVNLKGKSKLKLLIQQYGKRNFDYIGNSNVDIPIWKEANYIYLVNCSKKLIKKVRSIGEIKKVFDLKDKSNCKSFFKSLRTYQWLKNLLLFAPMLSAHKLNDIEILKFSFLGFLIFNMIASSMYIFNDLVDISSDRNHKFKKNRPFASGELNLLIGWFSWPLITLIALITSFIFMPFTFSLILLIYMSMTLCYSLKIKKVATIDVVLLSSLYTIRLIAGSVATDIPVSFWLLAFSIFIFLSLAFVKRFSELHDMLSNKRDNVIIGRGYVKKDINIISSMGVTSGYIAVLILAFYIQDTKTAILYKTPEIIWLACPLLLYWISRIWMITNRGEMLHDPILFIIKDKISIILLSTCIIFLVFAAKIHI